MTTALMLGVPCVFAIGLAIFPALVSNDLGGTAHSVCMPRLAAVTRLETRIAACRQIRPRLGIAHVRGAHGATALRYARRNSKSVRIAR